MPNFTKFDPQGRYIIVPILVLDKNNEIQDFLALLDTGAPASEFSDEALQLLGYLDKTNRDVGLKPGLQTHKCGRIILPHIEICSQPIKNLEVYVSHFEKSWGIKVLIGLDFFRRFCVTINYKSGQLITEPY